MFSVLVSFETKNQFNYGDCRNSFLNFIQKDLILNQLVRYFFLSTFATSKCYSSNVISIIYNSLLFSIITN